MKLLLLVQSEADVAHLEGAAKAILASAITGVWIVFSPAITVNASEAAAKLDGEIAQLRAAERQAAERGDYEAAKGYKVSREGKELDRAKALRDAWKVVPEEERKAKTQSIFSPFFEPLKAAGLNVRLTGHSDHYEREQWVAMLNSLSGAWFKPFTPGSFVVAWPESLAASITPAIYGAPNSEYAKASHDVRLPAEKQNAPTPQRLPQVPKVALSRANELGSMKHFSLVSVAKKLGIETEGKIKTTLIDEIISAETKEAAEPALAEY